MYECEVRGWWFAGEGNKINLRRIADGPYTPEGIATAREACQAAAASYWRSEFEDPTYQELLVDGEGRYVAEVPNATLPANARPAPQFDE